MEQGSSEGPMEDVDEGPSATIYPRALAIPEVLKRVFELMDRHTGAVALRVSRFWFDVGLEARWYELGSHLPLMEIIAPLEYEDSNGGCWAFKNSVGNADWIRFRLHANCVRVLKQDNSSPYKGAVPSSTPYDNLAEVVFRHPFGPSLTPRLEKLEWANGPWGSPLHVIPFLSGTLKHLTLQLTQYSGGDEDTSQEMGFEAIQQTLRSIKQRAPNVEAFEVLADVHPNVLVPSLLDGVISSQALTSIRLPPFCQTRELVRGLSTHPNLKNIETPHEIHQAQDERITQFVFEPEGFENLETLCMESSFEQATETLQSRYVPRRLEEVCLHHANYTTLAPLTDYFTALTQACSKLTVVGLCLYTNDPHAKQAGELHFDVFRPLLDCHRLNSLTVEHNHPLVLETGEVEDMGAAWKELRVLSLCFEPYVDTVEGNLSTGNDFTITRHIAKAMPLLQELGLYFKPWGIPESMLEKSPEAQFKNLRTLQVGTSCVPGDDPLATGIFLESLCARGLPSIEFEVGRIPFERLVQLRKWDQVARTCQLVRKRVNDLRARPL